MPIPTLGPMRQRTLVLTLGLLPALVSFVSPSREIDKLDPAVRAAVDSGRTAQVIVLGRTQLFEPVDGLEAFQVKNANRQRLALRAGVVAQLKKNATDEQRAILSKLGKSSAIRSLWIVNAMVVSLTPDEIRKASSLETVRFVYLSQETIAAPESPSVVSKVLAPKSRALNGMSIVSVRRECGASWALPETA